MCVQHVGLQAQLPAPHRDPGRGLQGAEGRDHGGQPGRQARHGHGECRVPRVCVTTRVPNVCLLSSAWPSLTRTS